MVELRDRVNCIPSRGETEDVREVVGWVEACVVAEDDFEEVVWELLTPIKYPTPALAMIATTSTTATTSFLMPQTVALWGVKFY
jgi:hypothetical protein